MKMPDMNLSKVYVSSPLCYTSSWGNGGDPSSSSSNSCIDADSMQGFNGGEYHTTANSLHIDKE